MSSNTRRTPPIAAPLFPAHHYLNDGYGIKSWLLTKDHKRIGLLYLWSIMVFFIVGALLGERSPARRLAHIGEGNGETGK